MVNMKAMRGLHDVILSLTVAESILKNQSGWDEETQILSKLIQLILKKTGGKLAA